MKRVALAVLMLVLAGSGLGWGQWWQPCCPTPSPCPPPPCCPPPPPEPSCYEGFWVGEPILIELVVPVRSTCCCVVTLKIQGWSVESLGGGLVVEHTYTPPVGADTKILWNQKTSDAIQVPPGFYLITVHTTDGKALQSYVKIVDRADCRSALCNRPSKPCGVAICEPHLKISAFPTCGPCCNPCCDPCCLYPFYILGGGK